MPDHRLAVQSPAPPPAVVALRSPACAFSCARRPQSGGSICLVLAGELDLAARESFETALAGAQDDSDRVLLDLGALTLIDCANLRVLFAAAARSRREDGVLILLSPQGQVRRVLDLVRPPRGVLVSDWDDLPNDRSQVAV